MGDSTGHPNWVYALQQLQLFVPDAQTFDMNEILSEDLDLVPCKLENLNGELERFTHLVEVLGAHLGGLLLVVADASYQGFGPFLCHIQTSRVSCWSSPVL